MIPRPPPGSGIRLFREPRVHQPGSRASARTVGGVWSQITSNPVRDPALELTYYQATLAYDSGDYDAALDLLEAGAKRVDLSPSDRVGLLLARAETLLVMGRTSDGYLALKSLVGEHRNGAYKHRCWLWVAQRELGLAVEARAELDWLDSDVHAAMESTAMNISYGMGFFSWIGELEIAERMLVRMLRARTMAAWRAPEEIEGNARLGWLASQGPAGAAGLAWGEGLLDRARAEAERLGPL
jgi:hypothetical protein